MGGLLDSMAVLKMNVLRGCLFLGSLTWWMSVDAGFGNGELGRLRFGELSRLSFFKELDILDILEMLMVNGEIRVRIRGCIWFFRILVMLG